MHAFGKKTTTATNNRKHYDYTLLEITYNNFSNMMMMRGFVDLW